MSNETPNSVPDVPLGAGIKLTTEWEYEAILGRLAAVELLVAQLEANYLLAFRPADRREIVHAQQIALEDRFKRLGPIAQRVAAEVMDGILDSSLKTAESIEKLQFSRGAT